MATVRKRRSNARHTTIARAHARGSMAGALTLAAMSLGFGVVQLDVTIVNTALNAISSGLGGGVTALQWVVNAYTIAFAALILTAGALGDRLGAKRVFVGGFGIFTLASLACALAPNAATLIAARAVQGLGAAILVPNSLALLNHAYRDANERARAVSFWAAGASIALTAGPLFGGALIAPFGWRAIFFVNIPIGLCGMWLAAAYAKDTPPAPRRKLDLPGQIAAILALSCFAGALIEAGRLGWHSVFVIGGIATAIVSGSLFVAREARTREPMLPLGLFANPAFSLATAIGLLVNTIFYGLIFVLSLYFQRVDHWSPLQTGLAFLPMLGLVLPANLLAPVVSRRIGGPATIAIGAATTALGSCGLLLAANGTPYALLCLPLVALGAGLGLLVPAMTSLLLANVDRSNSGIGSGVLNSARQSGSVVGVALFGSLVAATGGFLGGMHLALALSAAVLAATCALALYGRRFSSRSS